MYANEQTAAASIGTEQDLLDRWVETDPHDPSQTRLVGYGIHVWAIIGVSHGLDKYVQQVADDYRIPAEAVRAAHAYYRRHPLQIDARLEANAMALA